jgi:hypothetical protein
VTSLDDLLRYEDEPPPKPTSHRERPSRWLAKTVLFAVAGGLVAYLLLRLVGVVVPYPLLAGVFLALQVLRRVLRDLGTVDVPDTLRRHPAPADNGGARGGWGERDGLDLAVTGWDTRLSWLRSRDDSRQFIRTVQPRMVQIIEERLRLRHGLTLAGDPQRARELLGDPLWTFVSQPVSKNPSPRELAALVKQVEDL